MSNITHFYVFYVTIEGHNVYERTCGCEKVAKDRVIELKKIYSDALYFNGDIPKDFKYFY